MQQAFVAGEAFHRLPAGTHPLLPGLAQHGMGLNAYALHCVHNNQPSIAEPCCGGDFTTKVNMAWGVYEVDQVSLCQPGCWIDAASALCAAKGAHCMLNPRCSAQMVGRCVIAHIFAHALPAQTVHELDGRGGVDGGSVRHAAMKGAAPRVSQLHQARAAG